MKNPIQDTIALPGLPHRGVAGRWLGKPGKPSGKKSVADDLCPCNPNRFYSSAQQPCKADLPMRTRTLRRHSVRPSKRASCLSLRRLCALFLHLPRAKPDLDLPGQAHHASPAWNNLLFVLHRGQGLRLPLPKASGHLPRLR